jgi:hypothetical protein
MEAATPFRNHDLLDLDAAAVLTFLDLGAIDPSYNGRPLPKSCLILET